MNDPDNVVDPVVLAERRARRAELAEEELRELLREAELGAATLKGRLAAVEGELATARAQRDALAADLARHEKELIAASRREHAEQALRSEAQTRAAETETGSRRELDELRVRLLAAEQRAALLTSLESEVTERLERAKAAEDELTALRGEVQARQTEIESLRRELERRAASARHGPAEVDPQPAARTAAEGTAFGAQMAAVEHTVASLRSQLVAASTALADRLAAERAERERAERALADERVRVEGLQQQVAAAAHEAAIAEVVAELAAAVDELRERFARELHGRVAELAGTADALRAELSDERRLRSAAQTELERLQAEHAAAQRERADESTQVGEQLSLELERRPEEPAAAHAELERRQAERVAMLAELAREQAQHAAAQSDLGREQALRSAAEAELARERERLEAANAALDSLRAAAPAAPVEDVADLAPEEHAPAQTEEQPPPEAVPAQRDELASILAAQQEAAAIAAQPDPLAHLPEYPVQAVVPWAAGDGSWLRNAIGHVGRADPALGAQLLLALVPVQAHAVRRKLAYRLTVADVGTWRIELRDMEATIERAAPAGKVAFRISGSPGDLAAVLAGGGRRKLKAHVEGGRRALWRVARARREAPTLAQAVAAGGYFSLHGVLALLAAASPEGGRTVVAFDDGEHPITAVATRRGAIVLRSGLEQPQATLHGPEHELVALLAGLAPAVPIRVSGDVEKAAAFVTRLHRAQGLV